MHCIETQNHDKLQLDFEARIVAVGCIQAVHGEDYLEPVTDTSGEGSRLLETLYAEGEVEYTGKARDVITESLETVAHSDTIEVNERLKAAAGLVLELREGKPIEEAAVPLKEVEAKIAGQSLRKHLAVKHDHIIETGKVKKPEVPRVEGKAPRRLSKERAGAFAIHCFSDLTTARAAVIAEHGSDHPLIAQRHLRVADQHNLTDLLDYFIEIPEDEQGYVFTGKEAQIIQAALYETAQHRDTWFGLNAAVMLRDRELSSSSIPKTTSAAA